MRIEPTPTGGNLRLVLSERNLRSLLSKLSMPDSACTISSEHPDGWTMFVSAEKDDQHYEGRIPPGRMHPDTETAILDPNL